MSAFFRHKTGLAGSGVLDGMSDCHSHLLPGVDDGVRSLPETLQTLGEMEAQGVAEVWLTPHVMEDVPNTTAGLRERFRRVQAAFRGAVRLRLAAEYMLDGLFVERLEGDDLLPLEKGGRRCLLVETSCFGPPTDLHGLLRRIRLKGYHPLLAHPERYAYMRMPDYEALKADGVLFQMNLPSLAGMYGREAEARAGTLLGRGMYDLAGSDTHSAACFRRLVQARVKQAAADSLRRSGCL